MLWLSECVHRTDSLPHAEECSRLVAFLLVVSFLPYVPKLLLSKVEKVGKIISIQSPMKMNVVPLQAQTEGNADPYLVRKAVNTAKLL